MSMPFWWRMRVRYPWVQRLADARWSLLRVRLRLAGRCPECMMPLPPKGRHKMDCSRGRRR